MDLRPSTTWREHWLVHTAPGRVFESTVRSGKWLIFRRQEAVDDAWLQVLALVSTGALLCAKVSTRRSTVLGRHQQHVICVYTENWRARKDVMRVRDVLRVAGFAERLHYKRDSDTVRGVERVTYEA